jgi:hypothetical protein
MTAGYDALDAARCKTIGVTPPAVYWGRTRLWKALEAAFPVRFEPRQADQLAALHGVIAHGVGIPAAGAQPALLTSQDERKSRLARVLLSPVQRLAPSLRGRTLSEEWAPVHSSLEPRPSDVVLGQRDGQPVWLFDEQRRLYRSAWLPNELGEHEVLRDRLKRGRFIALLPILVLLRGLTEGDGWRPPPLRAAFMLDDPNLHSTRYGYAGFNELATLAARARFHVALATVPLDGWYASRRAASLVRQRPQLSLLVHGNDHTWCELGALPTENAALALAAQAQRRISSLERRAGIGVSRVMAPPHGQCSPVAFTALRRAGFLAACISRPYPWLKRAPADRLLAQWEIADVVAQLPVLSRYSLRKSPEDLVFRAFLGQPLIVYGHHDDLADGYALLEQIATTINSLGHVQWRDLGSIARSSCLTKRDRDVLRVRMYARGARVRVPRGVSNVIFETPTEDEGPPREFIRLQVGGRLSVARLNESVAVRDTGGSVCVRLCSPDMVSCDQVPSPPRRTWPALRRLLTESRDRLSPTTDALRRGPRAYPRMAAATAGARPFVAERRLGPRAG